MSLDRLLSKKIQRLGGVWSKQSLEVLPGDLHATQVLSNASLAILVNEHIRWVLLFSLYRNICRIQDKKNLVKIGLISLLYFSCSWLPREMIRCNGVKFLNYLIQKEGKQTHILLFIRSGHGLIRCCSTNMLIHYATYSLNFTRLKLTNIYHLRIVVRNSSPIMIYLERGWGCLDYKWEWGVGLRFSFYVKIVNSNITTCKL